MPSHREVSTKDQDRALREAAKVPVSFDLAVSDDGKPQAGDVPSLLPRPATWVSESPGGVSRVSDPISKYIELCFKP